LDNTAHDVYNKVSFFDEINFRFGRCFKPKTLALMAAVSFCGGVRRKKFSVQQVPGF
jgi:hypothetical protein